MWLCILSSSPFEATFENTYWRKVKQMQPMRLCIFSGRRFEETFDNTQWRLDYVRLCETQIEGIYLRIWTRLSKLIIGQERQTRISYLITMSPLPLENLGFVWSYLIYDDMMVIIWGYDDTYMLAGSYPHRKYMVCMLGNII